MTPRAESRPARPGSDAQRSSQGPQSFPSGRPIGVGHIIQARLCRNPLSRLDFFESTARIFGSLPFFSPKPEESAGPRPGGAERSGVSVDATLSAVILNLGACNTAAKWCSVMMVKIRWFVVTAGIAFYLAALALPSFRSILVSSDETYTGLTAFQVGFFSLISWEPTDPWFWILSVAWFANPMILISLIAISRRRWRLAGVTAGIGLACCLQVLLCLGSIVAGCPGYWAWVGSAGFLLASSFRLGLRGEGSNSAHLKIVKPDDYLRRCNLTGKRFSERSIELRENGRTSFFVEAWQHILNFRRSKPGQ